MHEKSLLDHKPDYIVCTCMCVMYSDVIRSLEAGAATFNDLQEQLFVGTGCSSCVQEIQEILAAWEKNVDRS